VYALYFHDPTVGFCLKNVQGRQSYASWHAKGSRRPKEAFSLAISVQLAADSNHNGADIT